MRLRRLVLLTVVFVMSCGDVFCQFVPFQDEDAIITPSFNTGVIRAERISKINMHFFSKPDGYPIKDEGFIRQYVFDTAGRLIESVSMGERNSISNAGVNCRYYYDASGNVVIKRSQVEDFYDTWYYTWNKEHLVQRETHVHETGELTEEGVYKIISQQIISTDSFAYIAYPKQLQQYAYNEDKQYFRKTITQYDDNKRFLSRDCRYAMGSLYEQITIQYDSLGRIAGYTNTGNTNGETSHTAKIEYNGRGEIEKREIWKEGKEQHQIEYMHDNETGLISNELDRENDKALITIIRFSYEMYTEGYPVGTR